MNKPLEAALNAEFEAWFAELQRLTERVLDPKDWTERWFDGQTPQEALQAALYWEWFYE